jgi:hypothetical protein
MARQKQRNGKKPYIKMTAKRRDGPKSYTPNKDLVNFLRTQLHRREEIQADREPSEDDRRKRNNELDRLKVYYLDKHIFPALANLAFFFEATAKHPELDDLYRNDIKDLLGIRRKKPSDKSKPKPSCGFMFSDLLRNILKVSGSPFEKKEILKDYSLILNHRAEEIVRMKVARSLSSGQYSKGGIMEIIPNEANVHGRILGDFDGALAWTGMLASRVENRPEDEEEPHRTFDFDTDNLLGVKKEKNGEPS